MAATGGHNASPVSWPVDQSPWFNGIGGPETSHNIAGRSPCQRMANDNVDAKPIANP